MNKERLLELIEKLENEIATKEELLELDAIYEEFESKPDLLDLQNVDKNIAYREQVFKNIAAQTSPVPTQPKKSKLWLSLAMVTTILICSAGLFYYQHNKQLNTVLGQNTIKPGSNKAILTLANGKKISLTDAVNGQIATQSGMRITKTAGGQLVYEAIGQPASNSTMPEYNTVEAPAGGQWQVILPDGSHVWLNALSSLKYPTLFSGKERKVELKGEAYFQITHNKAMPFRVASQGQTVEVLGTHFNIMAYSDEKLIKTTLLEGSIKVSKNGKSQLLIPGEQAQVNANIKVTDQVDLEDVVAWKNGYFKFNENLESIMSKISRWYDVEVVYENKLDPNFTFEGKISRSRDLSEILKIMEYNGKVHFKMQGRRIMVLK